MAVYWDEVNDRSRFPAGKTIRKQKLEQDKQGQNQCECKAETFSC